MCVYTTANAEGVKNARQVRLAGGRLLRCVCKVMRVMLILCVFGCIIKLPRDIWTLIYGLFFRRVACVARVFMYISHALCKQHAAAAAVAAGSAHRYAFGFSALATMRGTTRTTRMDGRTEGGANFKRTLTVIYTKSSEGGGVKLKCSFRRSPQSLHSGPRICRHFD